MAAVKATDVGNAAGSDSRGRRRFVENVHLEETVHQGRCAESVDDSCL